MKKIIAFLLCACMLFAAACDKTPSSEGGNNGGGGSTPPAPAENGYFVQDNDSEYRIIIPAQATANEEYAASEIRTFVRQTTGVDLPVESDAGRSYSESEKVISVGNTVYQEGADFSDVDYDNLTNGAFVIKSFGSLYVLHSDCEEGLLYSAYDFLERFFGMEFLTYDATYLPKASDVKAYEIDLVSEPAFPIRDYYSYPCWWQGVSFGAKMRSNSTTYKSDERVNGENHYDYYGYYYDYEGTRQFAAREGHSITALLSADAYVNGYNPAPLYYTDENGAHSGIPLGYFHQHHDWYAYDPAYSRSNRLGYSQEEVCYTNGLDADGNWIVQGENTPEEEKSLVTKMIEICKKVISEEVSESATYLMLGHGDYEAQCRCPACTAAYKKYGTYSGATIAWANVIVKEVKKWMASLPEEQQRPVKFVIFAYSKSIEPPVTQNADGTFTPTHPNVVPDEDIVVKMAYRNCVYHSVWDESCEQNEVLRRRFAGWASITKSFAIWDYTANFTDYLWYLPNWGTIRDNYLYYQEIGVEHLLSQGVPSEYNFYEHNLHMWVSCKLMWDPDQDVNELIERFNLLYFGEDYAPYVNEYRDIFENHFAILDATLEHGFHASTDDTLDMKEAAYLPLSVLSRAADTVQKAIDKAKTDASLTAEEKEELVNKLRSVKVTPQYMILDLNLVKDDAELKALATDFFESIDALHITYRKEGSTAENSFEEMRKAYGV